MKLTFMKSSTVLGAVLTVLVTSLPVVDANAANIRVKCDARGNQSKVSVDGNNMVAGNYIAKIISGSHTKKSPPKHTVGDEIEFDFSSDPGDVAAGATRIVRTFVQGRVTGQLINEQGFTVAHATRVCRR
ncbi:hypothetical protein [Nitrosomonas supralitoralis]|uniref:Uncharacterized protein n=1 Tax=Nitrosomonas supralitoralis TaxID=2116706 RepID=A0A2P7NWR1_9PROT|nr:hypothetical protein [Nitrosomonas supralitoralis]PSJ17891.1 hypothetical protein C7H79_05785 [Nitrosomonas supralitoralis]